MTLYLGLRGLILVSVTVTFFQPIGSRSLGGAIHNNNGIFTPGTSSTFTETKNSVINNGTTSGVVPGCALTLQKEDKDNVQIVSFDENKFLEVSHRKFDVEAGIVPGISYQVKLELPAGYEFSLEHWGLVDSHVKHRHGREKRRDLIEVLPADGATEAGTILCSSKNTYGGVADTNSLAGEENTKSHPQTKSTSTFIYHFDWFIARTAPSTATTLLPSSVTFRLRWRRIDGISSSLFEQSLNFEVKSSCNLRLKVASKSTLSLHDFWSPSTLENTGLNCTVLMIPKPGFGLETRLSNLSIYGVRGLCRNRFLSFSLQSQFAPGISTLTESEFSSLNSESGSSGTVGKFCGKIEDFSPEETVLTFVEGTGGTSPSPEFGILFTVSLPGVVELRETFSLVLNSLSPCQKVLLAELSGILKYEVGDSPTEDAAEDCSIVIHVPFGNTIYFEFQVGVSSTSAQSPTKLHNDSLIISDNLENSIPSTVQKVSEDECDNSNAQEFLEVHVTEEDGKEFVWCITAALPTGGTPLLNLKRVWKSSGNRVRLSFHLKYFPAFILSYESIGIEELTKDCDLGQISVEGGCVWLVESAGTWLEAENDCATRGGHLVTIQNEIVEQKLQRIIIESALFHPSRAYWIGANDRESEGSFQWTSGLPVVFTNWFPGWSHKNGAEIVNAQPNDDGLSGQDCVELRQQFGSTGPSPPTKPMSHWSKPSHFPSLNSVQFSNSNLRSTSSSSGKKKEKFYWNDRNCEVKNFYLCEKTNQPALDFECNQTIQLGPSQMSEVTFTSPTYPSSYPDNILCFTTIETLPGFQIVVNFEEFALEDSPSCKYDSLEISENGSGQNYSSKKICGNWNKRLKLLRYVSTTTAVVFKFESDFSHHFPGFKANVWIQKGLNEQCQDQHMHSFGFFCYLFVTHPAVNWKTAHQVCTSLKGNLASVSSSEEWNFVTSTLASSRDYDKKSIYWLGGSIDPSSQLVWADQMPFNFSAFHPSDLQSISEWKCLSMYWHEGGKGLFSWRLSDCAQPSGYICKKNAQVERRIAMNRTFSGTGGKLSSPSFPSPYSNNAEVTSRLIAPEGTRIVLRFLHLDLEPQEECLYDYVEIIDRMTRNTTRYCGSHLDAELGKLDFVSSSNEVEVSFRSDISGTFTGFEVLWRAVDVSSCMSGNPILTGLGNEFSLHPTSQGSSIYTPNFPHFNLPGLNCVFTIVAPAGQRIWLSLEIFEIGGGEERDPENCSQNEDHVTIELSDSSDISVPSALPFFPLKTIGAAGFPPPLLRPAPLITLCGNLTGSPHLTTFISYHEKLRIRVFSPEGRTGRGFLGKFKAIPAELVESLSIATNANASIPINSLNYPLAPPLATNLTFAFTSPANYILSLRVEGVVYPNCHLTPDGLEGPPYLRLHDPYVGGVNGTTWIVCQPSAGNLNRNKKLGNGGVTAAGFSAGMISSKNEVTFGGGPSSSAEMESGNAISRVVVFRTTFNRLEVTQIYPGNSNGIALSSPLSSVGRWRAEIVTSLDENFRAKVLAGGDRLLLLNACSPNPCANGGKCVTDGDKHICRCQPPFTGPFCGLSLCDLNPCLFGECLLDDKSYRCKCQLGYGGERCDRRSKPCDERPCSGRGECVEVNNVTYKCFCHAFWEGPRCESRMQNIPYRPLSERMLREPFWLGIITVAVVLLFITLVWCLKRHFPEKLEKLLNDDFDRNRGISWVSGRSPSSFRLAGGALGLRDPIPSTSGTQPVSPQASRSFLGRLGIRKPSLLSISSATSASVTANSPHTYENRTFSLDDLLRPSRSSMMMRTPSPHRRRNFSIHVRRDPSEKQQILQQLVSSGNSQSLDCGGGEVKRTTPKPTIAEIIQMSEKRLRLASASSMQNELSPTAALGESETSFISAGNSDAAAAAAAAAAKAEKKVTFARLMDKLAGTEMTSSSSSCSDCSCGEEKVIVLNPPTKKDRKGRFRRSKAYTSRGRNYSETDQDAESVMSSSDTTPDPVYPPRFPGRVCISPTGLSVSPVNSPSVKLGPGKSLPKMASADSLLALFRRFSGSSSAPPSPQYSENEESSAAVSFPGATPLSTPSSPRNSALSLNFRPPPAFHITTAPEPNNTSQIEVPVIDPFTQTLSTGWRSGQTSSITLEVPMRDYCLSPIHEVPTPIGTPMHSPAVTPMLQRTRHPPAIRIQGSSDVEPEPDEDNEDKANANIETGFPSPSSRSSSSSASAAPNPAQQRSFEIPSISISNESMDNSDDDEDEILEMPFTRRRLSSPGRDFEVLPDVLVHVPPEVTLDSPAPSTDEKDDSPGHPRSPRLKTKPPPLVFAANILSFFNKDTHDRDRKDENSSKNDNVGITVPILNVECATPTSATDFGGKYYPLNTLLMRNTTTVLPHEKSPPSPAIRLPDVTSSSLMPMQKSPCPWENPAPFNLAPPMITINQSSEAESDSDTPAVKFLRRPNLSFLSPFACNSERVPSESNLSTSGYSSMASPCPSRCPSVSPLCQLDSEDFHIHGPHCYSYSYSRRSSLTPASSRRSSLTGRRCSLTGTVSSPLVSFGGGGGVMAPSGGGNLMSANNMMIFSESLEDMKAQQLKDRVRERAQGQGQNSIDLETDSAIEIEAEPEVHVEPKKSEEFQEQDSLKVPPRKNLQKSRSFEISEFPVAAPQSTLQEFRRSKLKGESLDSKLNMFELPSGKVPPKPLCLADIVVTGVGAGTEKKNSAGKLSPVSSRSDSPISEMGVATGPSGTAGGIGCGLTSPWTDSDGMYDCASSEVQSNTGRKELSEAVAAMHKSSSFAAHSHHLSPQQEQRRSGRRRDRRMSAGTGRKQSLGAGASALISPKVSPVRALDKKALLHLDLPPSMIRDRRSGNLRTSPKRRIRAQPNLDMTSSSSTESIHSTRSRSNLASPITIQDSVNAAGGASGKSSPNSAASSSARPGESLTVSHEELSKASSSKDADAESKSLVPSGAQSAPAIVKISNPKPKISRLRTISLQIRFLRRLEQSLIRKRENLVIKGGASVLSRSDSTSSAEESSSGRTDGLLNQGSRSGSESFSSFHDTEEPLLSKSLRKRKKTKVLPVGSGATPSETAAAIKARKKKLRQYK